MDDAHAAARLHAVRRAGRRLGKRRHRNDGAAGAARTARHPHQHAGDGSPEVSKALVGRRTAAGQALTPDERRAWDQLDFFYKRARLRQRNGDFARRRSTGSRTRRSASPRGSSTTTRPATTLIARVFAGEHRRPHARRHPRQHHPVLADEHRDLVGASLLGHRQLSKEAASSTPGASRFPSP